MEFTAEKDEGTIPFVLSQILDTCVNGISLSDQDQPDNPIVYANEAFELITGYDREEILGRNCRFLQGEDRDQPEIERIREALRDQKSVTVTLRNYRKDGTLFYNRFTIRKVQVLFNQLIFHAIGYKGPFTDYASPDWPIRQYPNIVQKINASQ